MFVANKAWCCRTMFAICCCYWRKQGGRTTMEEKEEWRWQMEIKGMGTNLLILIEFFGHTFQLFKYLNSTLVCCPCYATGLRWLVVNHSKFAVILILKVADCTMPNYIHRVDKLIINYFHFDFWKLCRISFSQKCNKMSWADCVSFYLLVAVCTDITCIYFF